MTNIEKSTISITKASMVGVFIGNILVATLGAYWGTKLAIQKLNSRMDIIEIQYRNADEFIKRDVGELKEKMDMAINSYIGKAILPDAPKLEERRRR